VDTEPTLEDIRSYVLQQLDTFDRTYKRIINPHIYKVSLSTALKNLKLRMIDEFRG
jgi:nicotinate phosphoribosyltransferase